MRKDYILKKNMGVFMKVTILISICLILFSSVLMAQSLKIVTEDYPPYNYDNNGKVSGLATEVIQAAMKEAGMTGEIKVYPWARAYEMAQKEPNVLIYSIGRSAEREKMFKWVGEIAPNVVYFFSLADKNITINTLADAKKYKTASTQNDFREQYLIKNGFALGTNLDRGSDNETNVKKFLAGRVDLITENEIVLNYMIKQEGKNPSVAKRQMKINELSGSGLYMALSIQTSDEILQKLQKGLESIKKKGIYQSILTKYGVK